MLEKKENRYALLGCLILIVFSSLVQLSIEPLLNLVGMHFPNTFYQPGQVFFLDLYEYQQMAQSILDGKGFLYEGVPTTMRSPGYPLFLAFIYLWGSHESVIFVQCLLLSLSACLYAFLCWRLSQKVWLAVLSGVLITLYAPYQMMAFSLLADALFAFLLSLFLAVFCEGLWWQKERQRTFFIAAAVILAMATLVRPITLFLPAILYLLGVKSRGYYRNVTLLFVVYVLILLPWTFRNYQVTSRFIPMASTGAYNLWQGSYRSSVVYGESAGVYDEDFQKEKIRLVEDDYYIDYQAEKRFLSAALERIYTQPLRYIRNCFERMIRGYLSFPGTRDWLNNGAYTRFFALAFIQALIWFMAFAGLIILDNILLRRFISAILIYSFVFNGAFNLITRYVLPWIPLALVLGCLYLEWMHHKLRTHFSEK